MDTHSLCSSKLSVHCQGRKHEQRTKTVISLGSFVMNFELRNSLIEIWILSGQWWWGDPVNTVINFQISLKVMKFFIQQATSRF